MPTQHTVAVSDRHQTVLEWMVSQINTEKGLNLTVAQFMQARFAELIQPFDLRYAEWEAEEFKKKFSKADDATKATVKTALGL